MDSSAYRLVKRNADTTTSVEIATYRVVKCGLEGGQRYVIFKNDKRVAWAMDKAGAMQIHDMYASAHVFNENGSEVDYVSLIEEMRSKPQDNGCLHGGAD